MPKNIAIITARGGSKRIPRKNIKKFSGKPIIAYSIRAAIESKLFDEVMVSTDDLEIKEIALKYGAKVPFLRSMKNSDDFASTSDVMLEVIEEYTKQGNHFDYGVCIYPTAPFVTKEKLTEAFTKLVKGNFDSVFPIMSFGFPVQRSLKTQGDKVIMNFPEYMNTRSQDLETMYHDAGQFYFCDLKKFVENQKLYTSNSGYIVISEIEGQDIDTETDWLLAELKYKLMLND